VPEFPALTIYLDSNVLFSATYIATSPFLNFWRLAGVRPVTSLYAVDEVRRHIVQPAQAIRFDELMTRTQLVSDVDVRLIPSDVRLVSKDEPILAAAIAASVDYLITGDKTHFTHLYGKSASHVYVINPADFLALYKDRLPE
jgi:predicted nucleic acid-binding protein